MAWLNPPRHDDPHEDIVIELHPASAAVAADALTEAAESAGTAIAKLPACWSA